jgi:hypothetical protein
MVVREQEEEILLLLLLLLVRRPHFKNTGKNITLGACWSSRLDLSCPCAGSYFYLRVRLLHPTYCYQIRGRVTYGQ